MPPRPAARTRRTDRPGAAHARGGNQEVARHEADAGDSAHGKDNERTADRGVAPHSNDRNVRDGLIQHPLLVIR